MHEAYGDGFDFIFLDETPDGLHHIGAIERNDLVALVIHALPHPGNTFTLHEGFRLGDPGDVLDLVSG